jgi:uncharacterized protein (TIRG00374 family)
MTTRRSRLFLSWKALSGFTISAVALYFVFRDQDLGALWSEVLSAEPVPFALGTVAATAVFWVRAWRWKALLDPVRSGTAFRSRFAATTIGFMGNNVFPWRMGEIMRPVALSRVESLPLTVSVTTIVLERMLDTVTVMGLLFLSMSLPGLPTLGGSEQFAGRIQTLGTLLLVGLIVMSILVAWPVAAARLAESIVTRLPTRIRRPAVGAAAAFLDAVAGLRNPRIMLRAVCWSLVLWLVNAAGFWLAMQAFGLTFTFTAALFFQGVLVIAVAAPSAPGCFGVYELAAAAVLVDMWGADATTSNAFAAAYHIAGYIPVTAIGLYYAHRIGIAPKQAMTAASFATDVS